MRAAWIVSRKEIVEILRDRRTLMAIGLSALATPIVLTVISLAFMWWLAGAKHREGHRIECMPLIADSRETRLCSLMSGVALMGLGLNSLFGWWWADPIAGLGIAVLAVREGLEAWTGRHPEHRT